MEAIWDAILDLTSKLVIPDWGALVALIPVGLLVLVVLWLVLLVRRFATAGPTRRGRRRITPVPPAGIHMPGPSMGPIVVALGAGVLFWSVVVGGAALLVGAIALVLGLLVWGAEELRHYDQTAREEAALERLPEPAHAGPPQGVHMPGPSFRPVLVSLGAAVLFLGVVFGGWLLVAGIVLTIWSLLGWLADARREYVHTVEADQTGHLESAPAPRWPRRVLWVGALLVALAVLVDNGVLPLGESAAGGPPGASPAPGGGGGGGGGGGSEGETPASEAPGQPLPEGDVTIVAEGIAFTTPEVSVAGPDFTIVFDNRDPGTPHDVDILGPGGETIVDNDIFNGPAIQVYEVTGLEPAAYPFHCSIHPNMTGTITVE